MDIQKLRAVEAAFFRHYFDEPEIQKTVKKHNTAAGKVSAKELHRAILLHQATRFSHMIPTDTRIDTINSQQEKRC